MTRALLLAAVLSAEAPWPAGSVGEYTELKGHTISDPRGCTGSQCSWLGGTITNVPGVPTECGETDEAARSACVAAASKNCDDDKDCYAFSIPTLGQDGKAYGMVKWHNAGLPNAAPNKDWSVFFKSHDFPCSGCAPVGVPQLPNAPVKARYEGGPVLTHHCQDDRDAPTAGKNLVYCNISGSRDWGWTFLLLVALLTPAYVGGGVYLGGRVGGAKGLRAHPHFARWAELHALFHDGVSMARSGGGRRRATPRGSTQQPELLLGGGSSGGHRSRNKGSKSKSSKSSTPKESSGGSTGGEDTKKEKAAKEKGKEQEKKTEKGRWVHVPT